MQARTAISGCTIYSPPAHDLPPTAIQEDAQRTQLITLLAMISLHIPRRTFLSDKFASKLL